jgi:tetratricopeptide (TPR) repeat protein
LQAALGYYSRALSEIPDYAPARYLRGAARFVEGQFTEAMEDFDRVSDRIEIDTQSLHFLRGVAQLMLGQNEKAASDFAEIGFDSSTALWIALTRSKFDAAWS